MTTHENDPEWATEQHKDDVSRWRDRAEAQLQRARNAEMRVDELETMIDARVDVKSVGRTPEVAVENFCDSIDWGEISDVTDFDDGPTDWGRRFKVGVTYVKAGGFEVPGGYTLTWCKG